MPEVSSLLALAVVSRCLTIEEAYDAIDWKVVFLLGGIIPLGLALEQSGAARWLAESVLAPFADFGPLTVLAVLYLFTAILTEAMTLSGSHYLCRLDKLCNPGRVSDKYHGLCPGRLPIYRLHARWRAA